MKSILSEQRRSSAFAAIATILLGLVLVFWPNRSVTLMCSLLGGTLMIVGLVYVISWFTGRRKQGSPAIVLIPGVVLAGLGIWLMSSSETVITLIQYVFGAVVIFHGVLDIQGAVSLFSHRIDRWWVDALLAVLTLVLGFVVLINPFETFAALVMLIGLTLIYDGASDLWLIWRLTKLVQDLEKAVDGDIIETDGHVE